MEAVEDAVVCVVVMGAGCVVAMVALPGGALLVAKAVLAFLALPPVLLAGDTCGAAAVEGFEADDEVGGGTAI